MGMVDNSDTITDREEKVELTRGEEEKDRSKRSPVKVSLKTKLKDSVFRRKCWRTLWYAASFWALGFVLSQRGPAFLDLQIITRTNVEAASYFFTASSVGYLIGSLVAGVMYERFNKSLLLLVYLMGMAVTTVAVPWCSVYELMVAMHFVFSLFGGGLETVGNAEMVRMWGKEGEGSMQFIHFSYAFGGVIAPLVTEPFLTPVPEPDENSTTAGTPSMDNAITPPHSLSVAATSINHTVSSYFASDNSTHSMDASNISATSFNRWVHLWNVSLSTVNETDNLAANSVPLETRVHYAYIISGCILLLIMIPVTVQLFTDRSQKRRQTQGDEKKDVKQPLPLCLFLFVQGTLCLFNFLNVAVEDTFASFLSSFVVKQLHWSKSSGAQATSLFWALFAVCRFLSIFAVHLLSSVRLLLLSCSSLAASMLVFLLCSSHNVNMGVWVSSSLVGASIAAIFPTGFFWMEEELVRVSGRVASSIVISASAGSMSAPVLLGFLMQRLTPMWFAYLMLGEATLCLLVFLFLLALSRLYLSKRYSMSPPATQQEMVVITPEKADKADTAV